MMDVWTSLGVVCGVAAVALTGWETLDPLIALVVAANIIVTGVSLVRRSTGGPMDRALTREELERVRQTLSEFSETEPVQVHALRTRRAGRRAFVSVHVLVPGDWSVKAGHDLVERVEERLRTALERATVFTHLEPLEDPASFADTGLDRQRDPLSAPDSDGRGLRSTGRSEEATHTTGAVQTYAGAEQGTGRDDGRAPLPAHVSAGRWPWHAAARRCHRRSSSVAR
jgi:hypothetical protein